MRYQVYYFAGPDYDQVPPNEPITELPFIPSIGDWVYMNRPRDASFGFAYGDFTVTGRFAFIQEALDGNPQDRTYIVVVDLNHEGGFSDEAKAFIAKAKRNPPEPWNQQGK